MKRRGHSATVLSSTPTSVEILMLGGRTLRTYGTIYRTKSATTLLILSELLLLLLWIMSSLCTLC